MISAQTNQGEARGRRFEFVRDTFGFANELLWAYQFDPVTGKATVRRRKPRPDYTHRCFVLTRAVRQFRGHARFDAGQKIADDETYRHLIRKVIASNPRTPSPGERQIVIPGFACLHEFSRAREQLFKSECGGAWRSYFLRSHWRMVFPITRTHQRRTATQLFTALKQNIPPIIHLVNFPSLSINHSMVVFDGAETGRGIEFQAYDPNDPAKPSQLTFDGATQTFFLPANLYWVGGSLNVIEIYRGWFL